MKEQTRGTGLVRTRGADAMSEVVMRMSQLVAGVVALTLSAGVAFGDDARGNFNSWANDCPLSQMGDYYSDTLLAHAGGDPVRGGHRRRLPPDEGARDGAAGDVHARQELVADEVVQAGLADGASGRGSHVLGSFRQSVGGASVGGAA